MIKKWIIENFKSVNNRTILEFTPLTVFAGANSSGKSTIIQSLLLTTQTITSQFQLFWFIKKNPFPNIEKGSTSAGIS